MCGIIGYIGMRGATPVLLEGLKRMEYRGYDSAGVAVMNGAGVETRKAAGKISQLERALAASPVAGEMGIGHTRWATHGVPNECNAHPHIDCKGDVAVVHNGIIENSGTLKQGLQARGHKFASDTDTEVIAHLIEEAFDGNLEDAVIEALWQIEGTYGIAVVSSKDRNKIVAARREVRCSSRGGSRGAGRAGCCGPSGRRRPREVVARFALISLARSGR